jgi:hypothetical protein
MTKRGEAKQHSTVSVMRSTEEAVTERSEGIRQHSTVSVMGPTEEAP